MSEVKSNLKLNLNPKRNPTIFLFIIMIFTFLICKIEIQAKATYINLIHINTTCSKAHQLITTYKHNQDNITIYHKEDSNSNSKSKYELEVRTAEDNNKIMKERFNIKDNIDEIGEYEEINVELTFYTSLASCCGNTLGITASGETLNDLTIAVPRKINSTRPIYKFGTVVYIDGYGKKIVQDTGNPEYLKVKEDGTVIMDIYIPRQQGESDKQYRSRVLKMGRVQSKAKVYI